MPRVALERFVLQQLLEMNTAPRAGSGRVGGIALVHLLSPGGRILGEMTVSRLAEDRFYALSAAAAELRDADLLAQSVQGGEGGLREGLPP